MNISAGLLMYRFRNGRVEVFLVHPGGPFFKNKDEGYWSIPKGLVESDESPLDAAIREFREEIGTSPTGPLLELGSVRQKGGKVVYAWAFEGDRDDSDALSSNTFSLEWPPRSGRFQSFSEIDRAEFFPMDQARIKINEAQREFLERLELLWREGQC